MLEGWGSSSQSQIKIWVKLDCSRHWRNWLFYNIFTSYFRGTYWKLTRPSTVKSLVDSTLFTSLVVRYSSGSMSLSVTSYRLIHLTSFPVPCNVITYILTSLVKPTSCNSGSIKPTVTHVVSVYSIISGRNYELEVLSLFFLYK